MVKVMLRVWLFRIAIFNGLGSTRNSKNIGNGVTVNELAKMIISLTGQNLI